MSVLRVSPLRLGALWVSLLLCGLCAQAAPPKDGAAGGPPKANNRVMSKNELRACVGQQIRMQTQLAEAEKNREELAVERRLLEAQGAALNDERAGVDRTNPEAVAAFVAKAQSHDKKVEDFQARVPLFNAKVDAVQAEKDAYTKACEGRRYLEDDLNDIKAGK